MKRHVHMLDLDCPSHPRLRKSSCKDCVSRENEVERLQDGLKLSEQEADRWHIRTEQVEAEVERLRDMLEYIEANASGGDVPESWPEWVAEHLEGS